MVMVMVMVMVIAMAIVMVIVMVMVMVRGGLSCYCTTLPALTPTLRSTTAMDEF